MEACQVLGVLDPVGILGGQTAHSWANVAVVYFRVVESTSGYIYPVWDLGTYLESEPTSFSSVSARYCIPQLMCEASKYI